MNDTARKRATYMCAGMLGGLLAMSSLAADVYVDNVKGRDDNPGTAEQPLQSLEVGVQKLSGGDTLHLVPNDKPYNGKIDLRKDKSGTEKKPTVINGHGAWINRLTRFSDASWQDEGHGVFSLKMKQNAVAMSGQGYWSGFPFVFLDGKQINWVKSREDLVPETYLLVLRWWPDRQEHDPDHSKIFLCLPEGKTPADVSIEMPEYDACIVDAEYVIVKNLNSGWNAADAFDTAHHKGIVFENVRGSHCMDQGISSHSTDGAVVRYSTFDHAVDGGILDVNFSGKPETKGCRVKYVGCILEDNLHLGGAGFRNGDYEMESCIIRNNGGSGVFISKSAHVVLRNCYIWKGKGQGRTGISVEEGASMLLENCTVDGFPCGLSARNPDAIRVEDCVFANCEVGISINRPEDAAKLLFANTVFTTGCKFQFGHQDFDTFADFTGKTGIADAGIEIVNGQKGHFPPAEHKRSDGKQIGSRLDPSMSLLSLKAWCETDESAPR